MQKLLAEIRSCEACRDLLPHEPRPVLSISNKSKILIIGQAPGSKVHASGIPWDDKSGEQLRNWLGVNKKSFYDRNNFSILPMGLCYPGRGSGGDLPPLKPCAGRWHPVILPRLRKVNLILLIGWYAQQYYLAGRTKETLTETVKHFREYLPEFFPLVHPSPRNNIWLKKNPWFIQEVVPALREAVGNALHAELK